MSGDTEINGDGGAHGVATGLGSAEAPEPFGLRPTGAIPGAFAPDPTLRQKEKRQ